MSAIQLVSRLQSSGILSKFLLHPCSCVTIAKGPKNPISSCRKYSTDWQMFLAIGVQLLLCTRDCKLDGTLPADIGNGRLFVELVNAMDDSISASLSYVDISRWCTAIMPTQYVVTTWATKKAGKWNETGNTFPNRASSRRLSRVESSGQYSIPEVDFSKFPYKPRKADSTFKHFAMISRKLT
jgi:hypothetical protein